MGEGACALLRKACLQGRLLAGIWDPGFQKGSYHFLLSGLLCLTYLCKQCGSYILLSFWLSRIFLLIKQRLHGQPPVKTLSRAANKLPRQTNLQMSQFDPEGIMHQSSYVTWKLLPSFLQSSAHRPFPFADFVLYCSP